MIQIVDGVRAGMLSVAVPGLVARLLDGTRINIGQGAVVTGQGIGASLSPLLGGYFAQELGYRATCETLGALSVGSLAIWLGFASLLRASDRLPAADTAAG